MEVVVDSVLEVGLVVSMVDNVVDEVEVDEEEVEVVEVVEEVGEDGGLGEGVTTVVEEPEMNVMTLMMSASIISQILIRYKMKLTLDSIVWDNATSIFSVSRVWLRVRTLLETTLVPSSTKNVESLKRNSEMETTLTAVGTVAKLKLSVAMTRVWTSRRMVREVWNAVRELVSSAWLEDELTVRAGTVNWSICPVKLSSWRVKEREEREEPASSVISS